MKKIIFLGGSGFIGRYFVQKLIDLGNNVIIYDLKNPGFTDTVFDIVPTTMFFWG